MSQQDIIRAWKDEEYRNSLSEEQRSQLPENPAGMIELSDEDMESVAGGILSDSSGGSNSCNSCINCPTQLAAEPAGLDYSGFEV